MEPEKRMADLISVTSRLVDVLERENAILKERRHNDLAELLDEKETIGRVYQARIMGLQEDPEQLKDVDEAERHKLKELAHSVDTLVSENARMLEAAMYANKLLEDPEFKEMEESMKKAVESLKKEMKERGLMEEGS